MIQVHNLRQIKNRIKSIGNTRKITKAMEMVSGSKLSKVKHLFLMSKPYHEAMQAMLYDIISDSPGIKNALIHKREHIKKITLCIVTSDTGLCAAYNSNVIKCAEDFLRARKGTVVKIVAIGREGYTHFRASGYTITKSYLNLYGRFTQATFDQITSTLIGLYTAGVTDEVYAAYTVFKASLRHTPVVEKLLNIEPVSGGRKYYTFEPSAQALVDSLASRFISQKIRTILLEALTSEHSARMLAMKTATDNADDLVDQLTLARNKARQFAITKEVLEIAASAEALKG